MYQSLLTIVFYRLVASLVLYVCHEFCLVLFTAVTVSLTGDWVRGDDSKQMLYYSSGPLFESFHKKTCLRDLRPGRTQTGHLN